MNTEEFDERYGRLVAAGMGGLWLVNPSLVNLEELHNARPGQLIRCEDVNAIRRVGGAQDEVAACIAGWISEDV